MGNAVASRVVALLDQRRHRCMPGFGETLPKFHGGVHIRGDRQCLLLRPHLRKAATWTAKSAVGPPQTPVAIVARSGRDGFYGLNQLRRCRIRLPLAEQLVRYHKERAATLEAGLLAPRDRLAPILHCPGGRALHSQSLANTALPL